jgi:hypothetical protein
MLELLEERLAPAALIVNTALDTLGGAQLSLRDAITAVNAGSYGGPAGNQVTGTFGSNDTILFSVPTGSIITLNSALPVLSKSVQIAGPGATALTIDGASKYRLFQVGAGINVGISGLTLAHGSNINATGDGGAIDNLGSLAVSNCSFANNASYNSVGLSSGNGGAIANNGQLVSVSNCSFLNNSAVNTNHASNPAVGGALSNQGAGSMSVSGSAFQSNTADDGGAISTQQNTTLTITGCNFTSNTITGFGGAIIAGGSLTIIGSNFTSNSTPGIGGGAIYSYAVMNLAFCSFTNNTASGSGGALMVNASTGSAAIDYCTFSGNIACYQSFGAAGGAISTWNSGNAVATITGCTFTNNSAASNGAGGALDLEEGNWTLINSTITGNSAYHDGAIKVGYNSSVVVNANNCTIADNVTVSGGSTIGGNVNLYNSIIYGNNSGASPELTSGTSKGYNVIGYPGSSFIPSATDLVMPVISTVTVGFSGGHLSAGSYTYWITAVTSTGALFTGDAYSISIGSAVGTTGTITLQWTPPTNAGTISSYSVYGRTAGAVQLVASGIASTTYTDQGLALQSGTPLPPVNPLAGNGGPTQTMSLPTGSPAIDAGDPGFTPPPHVDQRGYNRVANGRIDIGAFESNSSPASGTAAISLTAPPLPGTYVGSAYNQAIAATGGTGTGYVFGVTVGALPPGLTLSAGGVLSGTATSAGSFNFTVTAIDSAGDFGSQQYTITVSIPTFTWTGSVSNSWSNPGNWSIAGPSTSAIPEGADDVVIPSGTPILDVAGYVNSVTIQANAMLNLNGNNLIVASNSTGALTIAGALLLDGAITAPNVDVLGGVLLGSGTLTGNLTVDSGGFLLPGDYNAGTLTVNGDVTFNSNSEFLVILNGNQSGQYSQLMVSGNVNLGSATVGVSQNYAASASDSLEIIAGEPGSTNNGNTVFNTALPHNVPSGFPFNAFTYGTGATVFLDPPVEQRSNSDTLPPVKATPIPVVQHGFQDKIRSLAEVLIGAAPSGPNALPATTGNTVAPVALPLDAGASFAPSSSAGADLPTRSEHAHFLAVAINGLDAPDLDLLPDQVGDPPVAPLDWLPSPADIDAAFRERSADHSVSVTIDYVTDACG